MTARKLPEWIRCVHGARVYVGSRRRTTEAASELLVAGVTLATVAASCAPVQG